MRKLLLPLVILLVITSAFNQKSSTKQPLTCQLVTDTIPVINTNEDTSLVFTRAETEPQFIGGTEAWRKFLLKNLNAAEPVDKKAPNGQYTVVLQFIVEKDGSISDIKALTKHGYGMEEECIRMIKLISKWQPATQNGRIVRCYKKQPITFFLSED